MSALRRLNRTLGPLLLSAILIWAGLIAAFTVCIYLRPPAELLSVLSGRTEKLEMRVLNPQQSAIEIPGMKVLPIEFGHAAEPKCLIGVLTPSPDSVVTYLRAGNEPPTVEIRHATSAGQLTADGTTKRLDANIALSVDTAVCKSSGGAPQRFPVWGPIDVGDNLRMSGLGDADARAYLMLSGKLSVYARAVAPFWFVSGDDSLYPIREITLTPGSRLTTGAGKDNEAEAAAWGFLALAQDGGFTFDLSTQATSLRMSTPGGGPTPDVFDPTKFVQVLSDPNLVAIQVYLGVAWLLLQLIATLVSIAQTRRESKLEAMPPIPSQKPAPDPAGASS